jgi:hypothetical protein
MWDLDPTETSYNESLEQSRSALVEPKPFGPKHLNVKMFGPKIVDYAIIILADDLMHRAML